ncbi:hypothetical protein QA596_04485 [Balneolales bacterium ANBcel1]|nr:hypothetical protein [Balneolales bacterium ANBcel1]
MDINKLSTHLNGTQAAGQKAQATGVSSAADAKGNAADKVTLDGYNFKKNEVLFARSEYDKQAQAAFERVKTMKAQLNEFDQAKTESAEKAASTPIGETLNSPDVWENIARKILDS